MKKRRLSLLVALLLGLAGTSGCLFFGGKKQTAQNPTNSSAAPDKVLYDRGLAYFQKGKYTEGRLALQTLINTYPDSEYLAKAKLAVANSYYKEGGTSGLTQAIAEYQDFITFFPFLDEAAYAQMQVAMAHYRMMEKPDRDRTQALQAEDALQTMLLKYPQSKWTPEATQRLREVQEVLAQGDFGVARFYYLRRADRAAAARLLELTARYPLFSQADKANWMLAGLYRRHELNEDAAEFYARIVRDYPLSPLVPDAKKELQHLGFPVPQPDPAALARMQAEQEFDRAHQAKISLWRRPLELPLRILHTGPNVSHAAHVGAPDLQPESAEVSATDVLKSAPGTGMAAGTGGGTSGAGSASTSAVSVESVGAAGAASAAGGAAGSSSGGAASSPAGSATGDTTGSATAAGANSDSNASASSDASKEAGNGAGSKKSKKEKDSSSKKKKGWHKIIPW
jgi:outer membrane protein assembly factor BamD